MKYSKRFTLHLQKHCRKSLLKKIIMIKNLSRALLVTVLFLSLSSYSCKKNTGFMNSDKAKDGVITGIDKRACPCCGGVMINFTGETKSYTGEFYLIDNDISTFGITDTTSFPVNVKATYTPIEKCEGKHIKITKLVRR